jgi:hypothetical protein
MDEPTLAERTKDKRDREVIAEPVTFMSEDGTPNGFKVDVLLNEKPDTNRFCYTIEDAEAYDFFYQPPLTEQEIKEGSERPPEIEGSYAVYHKTLKNNDYKTGKVMHIPRPQVWSLSDESTKVWADLSYDAGELCVTVPQKFIDTATYPVRVDPTFGYTSVGGTTGSASANWLYTGGSAAVVPASDGDLDSVSFYTNYTSGSGNVRMAVYVDSTGALLDSTAGASLASSAAWNTQNVNTGASVSSASSYRIAGHGSVGYSFAYDTNAGSPLFKFKSSSYANPLPDPISWSNIGSGLQQIISIYATYTEASGGAVPTQDTFWFD